ncbi:MAG TPA: hypothetical protein VHY22_00120 [Chthoniobacteraceae bacterium]|jgi:hypothetical protein|nr:hypothetical protein [Chthoniobacteraceae bacterium]
MSNPTQLVNVNLTTKTSDWTPADITFGEDLTLVFRFLINNSGSAINPNMAITGMKATVGNVNARPQGGATCLVIGSGAASSANTTAPIAWNAQPSVVAAAINALSGVVAAYGTCVCKQGSGGYVLFFGTRAAQVPIAAANNVLWPVSFVRVSAWQNGAEWVHQVRFTQAPVAFTSDSLTVLPPAPTTAVVQEGGTTDGAATNEVQSVYIPPNFLGSYVLTMGENRSGLLSVADTPATMTTALNLLGGGIVFTVTNPLPNTAYITFTGSVAGLEVDLLGVTVVSAPAADPALTLEFDRAELAVLLQEQSPATLPLEVWIETLDSTTGIAASFVAFTTELTIALPLTYPDLEDTPVIDWLRPASPTNYVPFGNNNVLTGQQFYSTAVGNGESSALDVTHGLDTEAVYVWVDDIAGNQLVPGVDFTVKINSANDVTVTALTGAPSDGEWTVYVVSAQTVAAWASGLTVTIDQVTGLSAILAAMAATVAALQALIPTAPPQIVAPGGGTLTIALPAVTGYVPMQTLASNGQPRPRALLPAQNTAVGDIAAGTFPLGAAGAAGTVVQNQTGAGQLVPAGFGIDETWAPNNGYVASDGRLWYVVNQAGSTNSFFAAAFERTLFSFEINSAMMPAGSTLVLTFSLLLQMLVSNTRAQYVMVIEYGTLPEDTSPATVALNLQNVVWATATPILAQGIIMDEVPITHSFGVSISVNAAGTAWTAQRNLYGVWTAGAPAPASSNFALRARLIQFDTEDAVVRPKGVVSYAVSAGSAVITI